MSREETDEAKVDEDERVYEEVQECVVDTLADIKMLLAMKSLHRAVSSLDVAINMLNQAFRESPLGDYAASVTAIQEKVAKLASELDKASLEDDDELITRAKAVKERTGVTLGQVSEKVRALTTPDIKPSIQDGSRSGFKPPTITVPKFSGALEDWQSFWSAFERSIHQTEEFSKAAKLHYLREAMQDKALYRRLSPIDQPDDFYDEAVAELKKSFDKPRQMHLKYVMNIFNLGQVQPTKSSLNKCADILRDSMDGIDKSKQTDGKYIFSSFVASLLPPKLANAWAEKTSSSKLVPSVRDLITFLKEKAEQPYFHEVYSGSNQSHEKKSNKQQPKYQGSVHVASAQPPQSPSEQPGIAPSKPLASIKGQSHNFNKQPFTCPSCNEAHYAFACKMFREMSVEQRTEYVESHSLCTNCLKPGNCQADCRSRSICQVCGATHNTFIHTEEESSNPPLSSGTVNCTSISSSDESLQVNKLLMTCEALLTGPTGKSMKVRALLDTGADTSSVTSQVASSLNLQHLSKEVSVSNFGSNKESIYQTTNFTISSFQKKDWNRQVNAIIID